MFTYEEKIGIGYEESSEEEHEDVHRENRTENPTEVVEEEAEQHQSLEDIGRARLQSGVKRASETKDRVSKWFSNLATRAIEGAKRMGTGTVEAGRAVGRGATEASKYVVTGAAEAGKAVVGGAAELGRQAVSGAAEAGKAVGRGATEAGKMAGRGLEKGVYTTLATPEVAAMAAQYAGKRGKEAVTAVRGAMTRGKEMGVSVWESGAAFSIEKKNDLTKRSREAWGRLSKNVSEARRWGVDQKNRIIEAHHNRKEAKVAERKAAEVAKLRSQVDQLRTQMRSITELLSSLEGSAA